VWKAANVVLLNAKNYMYRYINILTYFMDSYQGDLIINYKFYMPSYREVEKN